MSLWMIAVCILIVAVPLFVLAIPLLVIWTHHRRKMEELRLQRERHLSGATQSEFAALRAEIQSLRDTSMQYDLSFDTNLQQMERRLSKIEQQGVAPRAAPEETAYNRRF